jgi:hypothetical protein
MPNENLLKLNERMAENQECLQKQLEKQADHPERVLAIINELGRIKAIRAELSEQISELIINN